MTAKRNYEGLFLLDAGNPDFESASQPVRTILGRSQADILSLKPWDERRLAYEIQGRRRGLYVLAYFAADPASLSEIERDCELSEQVLRSMILHKETLTQEQINAETPVTSGASRVGAGEEVIGEPPAEDPRRDRGDRDRGDRDRGRGRDFEAPSIDVIDGDQA